MTETGYEQDFYAWLNKQAAHLRAKRWDAVDVMNVAEELEDMARSERRAVESRLNTLLVHLLKWRWQPTHRSGSWRSSIEHARDALDDLLQESPSLRPQLLTMLPKQYRRARRYAAHETTLPEATFPATCPWSLDELQDQDFLPEA